jgi:excisionase family DNA binding protein
MLSRRGISPRSSSGLSGPVLADQTAHKDEVIHGKAGRANANDIEVNRQETEFVASPASPSPTSKGVKLDSLPDVLTVDQVSAYLQVSRSVVYGEISAGRLPAVRLGMRVIRISKWALQRWLERSTEATSATPANSQAPSRMH